MLITATDRQRLIELISMLWVEGKAVPRGRKRSGQQHFLPIGIDTASMLVCLSFQSSYFFIRGRVESWHSAVNTQDNTQDKQRRKDFPPCFELLCHYWDEPFICLGKGCVCCVSPALHPSPGCWWLQVEGTESPESRWWLASKFTMCNLFPLVEPLGVLSFQPVRNGVLAVLCSLQRWWKGMLVRGIR